MIALDDGDVRLYHGDALDVLRTLPDASVDCCITSPPYYGLRDYGVDGQIGLEETPEQYIDRLVEVFGEVRRVLSPVGTLWLNMGDSYAGSWGARGRGEGTNAPRPDLESRHGTAAPARNAPGYKPKDLMMMPARLALALQADGWWLRSDIIWAKPNPMPSSATDRPTGSHEHVYLLTKSERYWYDAVAIQEPAGTYQNSKGTFARGYDRDVPGQRSPQHRAERTDRIPPGTRNARDVWTIATQPFPEAHYATFPEELARRCVVAGCPPEVCGECGAPRERIVEKVPTGEVHKAPDGWDTGEGGHGAIHRGGREEGATGIPVTVARTVGWTDCGHGALDPGVVLDPFMGSGTTALVARRERRHAIGIELSGESIDIASRRIAQLSLLAGAAC